MDGRLSEAAWNRAVPIDDHTTGAGLHDALAHLGGTAICEALAALASGTLARTPQPADGATYAAKLSKDEARVDFSLPAAQLARRIRAFNPVPVCWAMSGDERLRLWDAVAEASVQCAAPGTVLSVDTRGLRIATGDGALCVRRWQWPGGTPQTAQQNPRAPASGALT